MKLIFATNNQHKVREISQAIGNQFELMTMKEAGFSKDIPEPFDTLEANATEKSMTIYRLTGLSCFSEDTGLEVTALGGEPGVKSARYAGDERSDERNMQLLLDRLLNKADRSARFRTVISLVLDGTETRFEGICTGRILEHREGNQGFGYDPLFVPDGSTHTFAQMDVEGKARFSHRAKATAKLVAFLNNLETNSQN